MLVTGSGLGPVLASLYSPTTLTDFALIASTIFLGIAVSCRWRAAAREARRLRSTQQQLDNVSIHEATMRAVAENANDGLVFQDMSARILWANPAYCRIMGRTLDEIIGRNPQEFCFPPETRPSDAEIAAYRFDPEDVTFGNLHRHQNMRKNGERFWHEFSQAMVEIRPGERRVILASRDVTQQVLRERALEDARADLMFAAHHDALTGLPNRAAFLRAAGDILNRPLPKDRALGLLYIDLDGFKAINDTYGHAAGDQVLIHVADAILGAAQNPALTCRMGGDEYVMAFHGVGSFDELQFISDDLLDRIREPMFWKDTKLICGASVGLAIADETTTHAEDLIRSADFALYRAKAPGSPPVARYDADLHAKRERERAMLQEFSDDLDADAISFEYQPVLDAATGKITSFETLARWRRANGQTMPPDQFLRFAQRLNRIADIDFAAIRATASLTSELRQKGHAIRGAFNTSSAALAHPDFLSRVDAITGAAAIRPADLTAEVLETTFFGPYATDSLASARIEQLHASGYEVYLDDFGVGYAGLAHLGQLVITGIKLDRSLIASVVEDKSARIIVASILHMCHELGVAALAEGIETAEQAEILTAQGCHKLQGYGIARPMTRDRLIDMIDTDAPVVISSGLASLSQSA